MSDGDFFKALLEVFKTKEDLVWQLDGDSFVTTFRVKDNHYGITIRNDNHNGVDFYDVSFSFLDNNTVSHGSTNFNTDQFKVLGIVSNSIKKQIPNARVILFSAKLGNSNNQSEYDKKVKLYSRMAHKLGIENSMLSSTIDLGDETVFVLTKTVDLMNMFKQNI